MLIRNRVPVELINHCYAFGRQFLDQTYLNLGRTDECRMIDDERLQRLRRFGVPPTIDEWAGWYVPDYDTLRRVKYMFHTDTTDSYNLDSPYWITYGGEHTPTLLVSRHDAIDIFTPPAWNPEARDPSSPAVRSNQNETVDDDMGGTAATGVPPVGTISPTDNTTSKDVPMNSGTDVIADATTANAV